MSIEELVRAELHAVAEQVEVPSLPSLEAPRRSWRVVIVAAAAVVLVIGGVSFALRDRSDPPRPIEKPDVEQVEQLKSTAPTIPWVDGDRLFVGGRRVPGRWLEVYSAGDTWLARRADGRVVWGRGLQQHALGKSHFALPYDGPYLSPNGRYVAGGIGTGTVVDTETGRTTQVPLASPDESDEWVAGVTDDGVVLTTWMNATRHASYARRPGSPPVRLRTQDGYLTRTVPSGLLLNDGHGTDWVVDVVGTQLHRVARMSSGATTSTFESTSLSADRQWLLDLGWAGDRDEPGTLPITTAGDGSPAPVNAPRGWVFAPQLAPGYWEPEGTLVAFVVRPESREYRAARCAPTSGQCVLVEVP